VKTLKGLIERESGGDPVLARAIAGSVADEFNARGWYDEAQDRQIAENSEASFKLDRMQVDVNKLVSERPDLRQKLGNLFTNDIGPANIRLGTAVLLVELNRLQFDNFDPDAPFRSIANALLTDEGTVKAAAAWITLGKEEYERLEVYYKVPQFEQEALLVSWFKEGPLFVERFVQRLRTDPQAVPRPNEGGEAYLQNRKRILRALGE
jgi:hypothetical protein